MPSPLSQSHDYRMAPLHVPTCRNPPHAVVGDGIAAGVFARESSAAVPPPSMEGASVEGAAAKALDSEAREEHLRLAESGSAVGEVAQTKEWGHRRHIRGRTEGISPTASCAHNALGHSRPWSDAKLHSKCSKCFCGKGVDWRTLAHTKEKKINILIPHNGTSRTGTTQVHQKRNKNVHAHGFTRQP